MATSDQKIAAMRKRGVSEADIARVVAADEKAAAEDARTGANPNQATAAAVTSGFKTAQATPPAQATPAAKVAEAPRNIYANVNGGAPLNSGATREDNVQRAKDAKALPQIAAIYNAASAIETGSAPNQVIRMVMDPQTGAITRQVTDSRTGKPYQAQLTPAEIAGGSYAGAGSALPSGYAGMARKGGGYTTIAPDGTSKTYKSEAEGLAGATAQAALAAQVAPATLAANSVPTTPPPTTPPVAAVTPPVKTVDPAPNSKYLRLANAVVNPLGGIIETMNELNVKPAQSANLPATDEYSNLLNALTERNKQQAAVDAGNATPDQVELLKSNNAKVDELKERLLKTINTAGSSTTPSTATTAEGVMSPKAYRAAREKLGLSQQGQANREKVTLEEIKKREAK